MPDLVLASAIRPPKPRLRWLRKPHVLSCVCFPLHETLIPRRTSAAPGCVPGPHEAGRCDSDRHLALAPRPKHHDRPLVCPPPPPKGPLGAPLPQSSRRRHTALSTGIKGRARSRYPPPRTLSISWPDAPNPTHHAPAPGVVAKGEAPAGVAAGDDAALARHARRQWPGHALLVGQQRRRKAGAKGEPAERPFPHPSGSPLAQDDGVCGQLPALVPLLCAVVQHF